MCEYINGAIIQEDFTMEKTIYDESNGLWYELRGDYYIHCLTVPAQEELGAAAPTVHQDGAQTPVHGAFDQRQAEYIPCRHQRTGDGADASPDNANGRA